MGLHIGTNEVAFCSPANLSIVAKHWRTARLRHREVPNGANVLSFERDVLGVQELVLGTSAKRRVFWCSDMAHEMLSVLASPETTE